MSIHESNRRRNRAKRNRPALLALRMANTVTLPAGTWEIVIQGGVLVIRRVSK